MDPCVRCGGTVSEQDMLNRSCSQCGEVLTVTVYYPPCSTCDRSGRVEGRLGEQFVCPECDGFCGDRAHPQLVPAHAP